MRSLRKTFESSSSNSEEGKLNIPIKATVLSAMTIMSHMAITICLNALGVPLFTKMTVVNVTASAMLVIRCPLATLLTFAQKESIKKETRQKRQEVEREHSTREREERVVRQQRGLMYNDSRPELPKHIRAKLYKRQVWLAEEEDIEPAIIIV